MSSQTLFHNKIISKKVATKNYVHVQDACALLNIAPSIINAEEQVDSTKIDMELIYGSDLQSLILYSMINNPDGWKDFSDRLICAVVPTIEKFYYLSGYSGINFSLDNIMVENESLRFLITNFYGATPLRGNVDKPQIYDAYLSLTAEVESLVSNLNLYQENMYHYTLTKQLSNLPSIEINISDYVDSPNDIEYNTIVSVNNDEEDELIIEELTRSKLTELESISEEQDEENMLSSSKFQTRNQETSADITGYKNLFKSDSNKTEKKPFSCDFDTDEKTIFTCVFDADKKNNEVTCTTEQNKEDEKIKEQIHSLKDMINNFSNNIQDVINFCNTINEDNEVSDKEVFEEKIEVSDNKVEECDSDDEVKYDEVEECDSDSDDEVKDDEIFKEKIEDIKVADYCQRDCEMLQSLYFKKLELLDPDTLNGIKFPSTLLKCEDEDEVCNNV